MDNLGYVPIYWTQAIKNPLSIFKNQDRHPIQDQQGEKRSLSQMVHNSQYPMQNNTPSLTTMTSFILGTSYLKHRSNLSEAEASSIASIAAVCAASLCFMTSCNNKQVFIRNMRFREDEIDKFLTFKANYLVHICLRRQITEASRMDQVTSGSNLNLQNISANSSVNIIKGIYAKEKHSEVLTNICASSIQQPMNACVSV